MHKQVCRSFNSLLFCPGNKARVLEKALGLGADVVVADFEDAVAISEKNNARTTTTNILRHRRVQCDSKYNNDDNNVSKPSFTAVRINEIVLDEGQQDLEFLVNESQQHQDRDHSSSSQFCCDAIVLPKCEDVAVIHEIAGVIKGQIPIWCMIETSKGVLEAPNIAAVPDVGGLVLGSNDLTKCMHGRQTATREGLFFAMSACVTAARAYDKLVFDGVHNHIRDLKGLKRSCEQARDFGFSGKSLIHPSQIDVCHSVWRPGDDDAHVQEMLDIIAAWESKEDGTAVLVVNGRLVEELHVVEARAFLDQMQHSGHTLEQKKPTS